MIGAVLWIASGLRASGSALAWSGTGAQIAAICLWVVGVGLCALSLSAPAAAKPVYVMWMTVVVPIGIVMSTVLLTLLFVLLLPFFWLVVRPGDPLRRRLTMEESYWEDYKHHEPTLDRMRRQF